MARAAEDAGVTLALELLNSKVNHPDYQCDHTAWGLRVCEAGRLAACQTALRHLPHAGHGRRRRSAAIRDHHAAFGHYHTAGNPGRNELDETQELNYRAIVRAIRETGYDGYIGQEFIPRGEPVAALRAAFEVCQGGAENAERGTALPRRDSPVPRPRAERGASVVAWEGT